MERRVADRIAAKAAGSVPKWNAAPAPPERAESSFTELTSESGSTDVMDEIDQLLNYDDNKSGPRSKRIPPVMESGIRASRPDEAREMSFTVYKLEDLDARARVSAPPSAPPPPPSPWPYVWASAKALFVASQAWKKELVRPKLGDALAVPIATLRNDLWTALKTLPWKKIGIYGGSSVGGFLFLLVAVLMIADLTDDVKPTLHVTNEVAAPVVTDDVPPPLPVAPAPPPASAAPAIELEIEDAPAATPKKAARPHAAKKKKKPTAADIFNP